MNVHKNFNFLAIFLLAFSLAVVPIQVVQAATLIVNSTADPGSGVCDAIECTLREAIDAANASPGLDYVNFNIPGAGPHTITLASGLPEITSPVVIDGTAQPGFSGTPIILLDGKNTSPTTPGLNITAGGSTVRGLVINGFKGYDSGTRICGHAIILSGNGGNVIEGNYIGTDITGTSAVSNADVYTSSDNLPCAGVYINQSSNNTIGGTLPAQRNVISGNEVGIYIRGIETDATNNIILGNYIGTDVTGTVALGNGFWKDYDGRKVYLHDAGVRILWASANTVGGSVVGAKNLLSGNDPGIGIRCGKNNKVQGNFIGTDVTGSVGLAQGNDKGVAINGLACESTGNLIGGIFPQERNLISGNNTGVDILSSDGGSATGTQVQGNYIGTDVSGVNPLGNIYGVYVTGWLPKPSGITIGGTTPGAGNLISGNERAGITLNGVTDSLIQGNYIGTDATGKAALPNSTGIALTSEFSSTDGSLNNTIGGNLLAGNEKYGLYIGGGSNNLVQGNYIGTDATGSVALGNGLYGIALLVTIDNTIGGTMPVERNVISGNGEVGILISGNSATGNQVQGNYIGTDASGLNPLGNGKAGVWIQEESSNNTIGGTQDGAGNLIAFNNETGVQVSSGTGNLISENSIFSHTLLGIDLGVVGVTANDPSDVDSGANDLQNYPVLSSVTVGGTGIKILGVLQSLINTTYTVEFFSNNTCDPSGYGEGQVYLGSTNVTTAGSGAALIDVALPTQVPNGRFLTATVTDSTGNTSEFSACIKALANQPPVVGPITAPANPVQVNIPINISANFTDPDITDTHTASIDWGDSNITTGTVTEANGSGIVNGIHRYTTPGIYTITLTVTDDNSGIGTATFQYITVYDPNGGYVTGGGWINSPAGAYTADPTLTGKATFGFVSKYQKGANVPTGNTEFQFKVADLNFKSTSYDWLVIAGSKAQYKGTGTINGTGEYKFILTAIDGSPDMFRIKIWDKVTDEVIYDNQLGDVDNASLSKSLGGGSIVIHKEK